VFLHGQKFSQLQIRPQIDLFWNSRNIAWHRESPLELCSFDLLLLKLFKSLYSILDLFWNSWNNSMATCLDLF
jgi:hypothetical protein